MRTVLDTPRLHDWPDRPSYWHVTVGGIPCGTVYQRDSALYASHPQAGTRQCATKEQAADWLAAQEVGR